MLEFFTFVCEGILLVNILVLLLSIGKTSPHRVLLTYSVFVFVIQAYSHWLRNSGHNNLYLSHILFPGQCLLLNCFCYLLIDAKILKKILFLLTSILCIVAGIYILLSPVDPYAFNRMEIFTTNISVIIALFLYLYDSLGTTRPFRLATISLLVYFISSTVIFISGNLLVKFGASTHSIWMLHIGLFFISQLSITIDTTKQLRNNSIWKAWKQRSLLR